MDDHRLVHSDVGNFFNVKNFRQPLKVLSYNIVKQKQFSTSVTNNDGAKWIVTSVVSRQTRLTQIS